MLFRIGVLMNKKKGFTLIELLVVISIIALLVAILMPSLGRAKKLAQGAVCKSNLKQWGTIWAIYGAENEGKTPYVAPDIGLRIAWIADLYNNYPTDKIVQCPSASKYVDYGINANVPHGGVFTGYKNINPVTNLEEICSYGMNCWTYSSTHWAMGGDAKEKIWGTLDAKGGNQIPLFMDSAFKGSFPEYNGYDPMTMEAFESPNNGFSRVMGGIRQFALPRHGSGGTIGVNVLFLDLTVRHVMVKEMWSLKWHRKFDTNQWKTERNRIWPGTWMDKFSESF